MKKVRLIIKETNQPPFETPATISYFILDIDCKELKELLKSNANNNLLSHDIIGAELLK